MHELEQYLLLAPIAPQYRQILESRFFSLATLVRSLARL
jgi:hypothetical protein